MKFFFFQPQKKKQEIKKKKLEKVRKNTYKRKQTRTGLFSYKNYSQGKFGTHTRQQCRKRIATENIKTRSWKNHFTERFCDSFLENLESLKKTSVKRKKLKTHKNP